MKNKAKTLLPYIIALIILAVPIAMTVQVKPLQIDDTMYASWHKEGFAQFFVNQYEHYATFNGRFIVHFLLSAMLSLGNWTYGIMPIILFAAFLLLLKSISNIKTGNAAVLSATGVSLYCLADNFFVTETLFWMAGGFNYILPFFFFALTIWLLKHSHNKFLIFIACFICGASQEQFTILITAYMGIILIAKLFQKENVKAEIMYLIGCVIGGCSILFSPATFTRVEITTKSSLKIAEKTANACIMNFGKNGHLFFMLAALSLLSVLSLIKKNQYPKLYKWLPVAIVLCILSLPLKLEFILVFILPIVLLITIAQLIKNKNTRDIGILWLVATIAFFAVFIVANGMRITAPLAMITILLILYGIYEILLHIQDKKAISIILMCILIIVNVVSSIMLFVERQPSNKLSYEVYNEFQQANTSNQIVVDWDKTGVGVMGIETLRYQWIFDGTSRNLTKDYEKYFGYQNKKIVFTSKKYKTASVVFNGKHSYFPAIYQNEKWYIPNGCMLNNYNETDNRSVSLLEKNGKLYGMQPSTDELLIIDEKTNILLWNKVADTLDFKNENIEVQYIAQDDFCEWLGVSCEIEENGHTTLIIKSK